LDVGCGEGDFARLAQGSFRRTLALDVSRYGLAEAKRKGCTRVVCASAVALPVADASIEVLVALDVVEHLSSPRLFFSEATRALAPGGILAISTPNPDSLGARWKGRAWFGLQDSTHVSILRMSEWRALVSGSGFDIVGDGTDALWDVPYFSTLPASVQRAFFINLKHAMHLWDVKFRWTLGENYVCIARRT
jgi:SAM-dependent methyltransferase